MAEMKPVKASLHAEKAALHILRYAAKCFINSYALPDEASSLALRYEAAPLPFRYEASRSASKVMDIVKKYNIFDLVFEINQSNNYIILKRKIFL